MMILLNNISWMGWNVFLALIPPIFGWLLLKTRQKVFKVTFALIWFFFLPNTLYLITDLPHIIWQWQRMHHAGQLVLALQYITLVLIGVGIVLGRVQRVNSWDIVVDIPKVIGASLNIFSSLELILFVLFFGVFANVYYFVCRKSFQVP